MKKLKNNFEGYYRYRVGKYRPLDIDKRHMSDYIISFKYSKLWSSYETIISYMVLVQSEQKILIMQSYYITKV